MYSQTNDLRSKSLQKKANFVIILPQIYEVKLKVNNQTKFAA